VQSGQLPIAEIRVTPKYRSGFPKLVPALKELFLTTEHDEKLFSIFETYTGWITKGKQNPSVEPGKNFRITTDQFNLIADLKQWKRRWIKVRLLHWQIEY
jgi:hypothetical protein